MLTKLVLHTWPLLGCFIWVSHPLPTVSLPPQQVVQTQDSLPIKQQQPLQFIGTGEPKIQILQGVSRTKLLTQMLRGGKWLFYPDGKFMYVPSPNANVRDDLYPITGTYKKVGNSYEFQGERQSSVGTIISTASVDGVIRIENSKILLEVTQGNVLR
jgi:hypothetical protein